jgi:hypothetical protein
MKILKVFFLLGIFFGYASCRDVAAGNSGNLVIKVGPSTAFVIPAPLKSCVDIATGATTGSLGKESMQLSTFTVQWNGDNPLTIVYIHMEFDGSAFSGGVFKPTDITDDELVDVLGFSGIIAGKDNTVKTAACSLRIGGMAFANPHSPASGSGTVYVVGYQTDANGNSSEVTAQATFGFVFDGEP